MDRVDCPVYRPSSMTMLTSMESFIESIEADSTCYGICKIIPPSSWKPCAQGYNGQDNDMLIGRTDQEFTRETMASGFYSGTLTPLRKQTVQEFRQEAQKSSNMRKPASRYTLCKHQMCTLDVCQQASVTVCTFSMPWSTNVHAFCVTSAGVMPKMSWQK